MTIGKKLSLTVVLGVFLVTIPAIAVIYKLTKDHYLASTISTLYDSTQASIAVQITIMRRAEQSLETLSKTLKKRLLLPADPKEIKEFDSLVEKDELGVIRNRKDKFDGSSQAGVFIPKGVEVTDSVKRTKLRAMKLLSSFGLAALKHYDGVWFDQLNKTSVIFWRRDADFIYKLEPDHDYTQTLWDQLASPELNPDRIALWTPAIYESPVDTWVVSAVYPLDIDGRWEGILGHDIALTELLTAFRASSYYQGSQHFLVDGYGNYILAGFWQQDLESKGGVFKPDLSNHPKLEGLLTNKNNIQSNTSVYLTVDGKSYIVFSVDIDKLNWRYLRLIPVNEILTPVQTLFLLIASLVLLSGVLIIVLINANVRHMVVKPIQYLSEITAKYGAGDLQQRAQLSGDNELATMGSTFNHMADNIADKQKQLIKSEARYRFVLNSIHEAIVILDQETKISFINPAFSAITGFSKQESYTRKILDLLHPMDRDPMSAMLSDVWNGVKEDCHGENRLKTARSEYIWVDMFFRVAYDNNANKVLSATLIDITNQVYAERIDWILSEAENKILYGAAMKEILFFICRELVVLLDYPLIWICLKEEGGQHLEMHASAGINQDKINGWDGSDIEDTVMQAFTYGTPSQKNEGTQYISDFAIPLLDERKIIGVISFQFETDEVDSQVLNRLIKLVLRISTVIKHGQNQQWLRLQNSAMETAASSIFITDTKGKIVWGNDAFSRLSGYQLQEVWGKMPEALFYSEKQGEHFWRSFRETLSSKKIWRGEVINQTKQGQEFIVSQSVTPILDNDTDVTHFITVQEDITEKKETERHMQHVATHDSLTDLANRVLLMDYLKISLAKSKRQNEQVGVLFLDLDHFKLINDTQGHSDGDELLKQVAKRLTNCVFDGDLVARLGGDEFVIVVTETCFERVNQIATKVLDVFKEKFVVRGFVHSITTSIGICLFPDDGKDATTLIKNADTAMYHAKATGKNSYQFFTETLNQSVVHRVQMENDLRRALDNQEFSLVYQPQIAVQNEQVIGLEALVRWQHPKKGMISPAEFIPIAEETGLILRLGEWILMTACRQMQIWLSQGFDDLTISVNLSAKQFRDKGLIALIKRTLELVGLPANYLMVELTESMMMSNVELHIQELTELKELGVKVSIDDFGTGYSSLSYLKRLPIDELKIDKSFVDDICDDENDRNIVRSIITLGHNLNLSIVAEGVEDQEQLKFLKQNGCDIIQGYLFSKPLAPDELNAYLGASD